ncbi:integral membrane protein [Podospora appendiculata]|uniref:Integral membrane protein n=1 Tax=Podospora appendiculata TaxID=314037 RepID=A0AAE1CGG3_9PEZI|nr:integral membrane protein [Podospora appendiculata]
MAVMATTADSGNLPGESRAYQIQIPCIVFFLVTPFFVALRVWARVKPSGWSGLGMDDWTLVASLTFTLAVMGLMLASCANGFGQHIANLSKPNKLMTLKLYYVAQAFYKLTINLTKTSILILYLRIFVQRWFRIICYTLLGIILAYMVATFCSSVFQCTPIPRAWDKSIPGTCISITTNWYANAGFSIATDILILGLPMYPINASHLPRTQKIALMVVFALGSFTTVTSILRMQTLNFSTASPDTTHDIASSIWTMIEENLAIICACLPVCRLPLAYVFPTCLSSSSTGKKSTGSSGSSPDFHSRTDRSYTAPRAATPSSPRRNLDKEDLDAMPGTAVGWEGDAESGRYILSDIKRPAHDCQCHCHGDAESHHDRGRDEDSRPHNYDATYDNDKSLDGAVRGQAC